MRTDGLEGIGGELGCRQYEGNAHTFSLSRRDRGCEFHSNTRRMDAYSAFFRWDLLNGACLPLPMRPGVGFDFPPVSFSATSSLNDTDC